LPMVCETLSVYADSLSATYNRQGDIAKKYKKERAELMKN